MASSRDAENNVDFGSQPIIRRRKPTTQRSRQGLIRYARNNTSQNGEDGILDHLFNVLLPPRSRYCVDVGAWDGRHLSNTYSLLVSPNDSDTTWKGVLIEADTEKYKDLQQLHQPLGNVTIQACVSCIPESESSLVNLLQSSACSSDIRLPLDFDFLCIDIDGCDYWILHDVWNNSNFRPLVVCIEFNPSMPQDLIFIPPRNDSIRHGASLAALVELADDFGYVLVETTVFNAFFVPKSIYQQYVATLVPDTSIEALHEISMGTQIYQLYNGTLQLWGCKRLLWHRQSMDEEKLQALSPALKSFPFEPNNKDTNSDGKASSVPFDYSSVVNINSLLNKALVVDRQACAKRLLESLRRDGFCYISGTQISRQLTESALRSTSLLLEESDESVRRSCLAKDRARRGYSPMCTENFASLLGQSGKPNDLVRKFRIGPIDSMTGDQSESNSLLQPNVWPEDSWDHAKYFRESIEAFYKALHEVAMSLLKCLCQALIEEQPELEQSLQFLSQGGTDKGSTSILTLLGYRSGSRHKGKNKGPLVAAHTDVGVITVLLYDGGDCAELQRARLDETGGWEPVPLPYPVTDDPVFVVNIADCLSDLSGQTLPSTVHQVVAKSGCKQPRNCCALFVGLDSQQVITLPGRNESIVYEEWRKQRIATAQSVNKGKQ